MIALAIHGGAGALPRSEMNSERETEFHAALREALEAGRRVLDSGGASLDAVEASVVWMEDCPLFNAGRGSAFTRDGRNEMEASIMDGATQRAGAAQLLRRVRNPVRLARAVMEKTPHVTLAGEEADRFALDQGLPLEPESYFFTSFRYEAMLKLREKNEIALSEDTVVKAPRNDQDSCGTVGAVALDSAGNLAAATSSGGTANKYAGRIGQASIVGAGVYAYNPTCAVSCTGHGESFMRVVAAHQLSALIEHAEMDLSAAADTVIYRRLESIQGRGGLIALDRRGRIATPFNTEGMYRAWLDIEGRAHTAIYKAAKAWPVS